jgi:transposase
LLTQVLVAKYSDHLPLYRQERIFGRAGVALPRSTLAQWVGSPIARAGTHICIQRWTALMLRVADTGRHGVDKPIRF